MYNLSCCERCYWKYFGVEAGVVSVGSASASVVEFAFPDSAYGSNSSDLLPVGCLHRIQMRVKYCAVLEHVYADED
jgi:hypothetical protein